MYRTKKVGFIIKLANKSESGTGVDFVAKQLSRNNKHVMKGHVSLRMEMAIFQGLGTCPASRHGIYEWLVHERRDQTYLINKLGIPCQIGET